MLGVSAVVVPMATNVKRAWVPNKTGVKCSIEIQRGTRSTLFVDCKILNMLLQSTPSFYHMERNENSGYVLLGTSNQLQDPSSC